MANIPNITPNEELICERSSNDADNGEVEPDKDKVNVSGDGPYKYVN